MLLSCSAQPWCCRPAARFTPSLDWTAEYLHDHGSGVLPNLHAHLSQACLQAGQKLQGTANAQPLYVCPLLSSQQTGPDIVPAALGGITSLLSAASQQLQAGGKTDNPTGGLDTCIPLGVTSDS